MTGPLKAFCKDAVKAEGLTAIGLLYRDEGDTRPILDVYALWSTPLDLDSERQGAQMDRLGELHGALALGLDPHLDTFLDFVDPSLCPSLADFKAALHEWANSAKLGRVLACAEMPHLVGLRA